MFRLLPLIQDGFFSYMPEDEDDEDDDDSESEDENKTCELYR